METLNDLIWNPEDEGSIDTTGIGGEPDNIAEICMTAFCGGTGGGGYDTAGSDVACSKDSTVGTFACG